MEDILTIFSLDSATCSGLGICPWYRSRVAVGNATAPDPAVPAKLGVRFNPSKYGEKERGREREREREREIE